MRQMTKYDDLIKQYAGEFNLDWMLIKAQIIIESNYNPQAVSCSGARGLMQITSRTWSDFGEGDIYNPADNIKTGCKYMKWIYEKYPEIPLERERYKFTLGAYNAGRRNINKMLELARSSLDYPASYRKWKQQGQEPGKWQEWDYASRFLTNVMGSKAEEPINYVIKVMNIYLFMS